MVVLCMWLLVHPDRPWKSFKGRAQVDLTHLHAPPPSYRCHNTRFTAFSAILLAGGVRMMWGRGRGCLMVRAHTHWMRVFFERKRAYICPAWRPSFGRSPTHRTASERPFASDFLDELGSAPHVMAKPKA